MTDIIKRLRKIGVSYAQASTAQHNQLEAADEIERLAARLEAAEKERDECNRRRLEAADHFAAQTALMKEKYDALRAKIERMENQEPTIWVNSSNIISAKINKERRGAGDQHTCSETKTAYHDAPLYALPGAKGEEK